MKIQALLIILLITVGVNKHRIDESFIIRVLPDNGWVLKFENNGHFEYYHWNGWGGTTVLNQGTYELKRGLVSFQNIDHDSSYRNEIPEQLYRTKLSKKDFKDLDETIFAHREQTVLFKKQYIVLSKTKLKMD